jgi:hypothetical protein
MMTTVSCFGCSSAPACWGFLPESAHAHSCCLLLHDPDFVIPEEAAKMYWEANSRKVYRVLTHKDIKNSLKDTDVYILWPDDGIWYMAEVEQVRLSLLYAFL